MSQELEKLGIHLNDDYLDSSLFVIINGKTKSGKSHFLRYLMREIKFSDYPFDYGVVFCNTAFECESYEFIDKKYIHKNYDKEILENLIKLQESNIKKKIYKRAFVIFDDCLTENELHNNSSEILTLSTQGRHYGLSVFICCQYPNLIAPTIRTNATHSFLFDIGNSVSGLKALYDNYGQRFENYKDFKKFYYENIEDHKFIGIIGSKICVFRCPENIPYFLFKYNKKLTIK